ncbi:MAG TPA: N-acetylmuramoyl-L-alanine amidase, partial [Sumerlaeia bacterium]|nr:N-acetylmuramoyl-L-alanine amidase [Sumerlaeia bacterium]
GVQAAFPDKQIPIRDTVLIGLQTITYADLNVLRMIFYPSHKTVFRVADLTSGFVYQPSPPDATTMPARRKQTDCLVIDTAKYRHYPLPPLAPGGSVSASRQAGLKPGGRRVKRLVVLDPGHGGSDSGAKSVLRFGGKRLEEKDVVLAIAKETRRLLNKSPNVTAVLTRERDVKMELKERVEFAEKTEGDLFVSIHANATKPPSQSPTARGAEFFYLGENSKAEVRALVETENQAGSAGFGEESPESHIRRVVFKSMAKDNIEENRAWASVACQHIEAVFDRDTYFSQFRRGIKQGGFLVLVNQVMPAVLIEVGFINHERESRVLAHPEFQKRIAKLIANGVLRCFAQLDSETDYYQYEID